MNESMDWPTVGNENRLSISRRARAPNSEASSGDPTSIQGTGKGTGNLPRHDQAARKLALRQNISNSRSVRGNDWQTTGHGLQRSHSESLMTR